MSFTSFSFVLFISIVAVLWPFARKRQYSRWFALSAFSLTFYSSWDWRFTFLLVGTVAVDFFGALAIARFPAARRFCLGLSLAMNLGVLFAYKYSGFAAQALHTWLAWPSTATCDYARSIILPVGISFYTFQSLSYTIDVYRGHLQPTRNFLHLLASVSLFPHLVAGPIIRAADILPQLLTPGQCTPRERWLAVERIALGLFKKLVLADHAAPFVNETFSAQPVGGAIWWLAMFFFAIQIYCDFSGYSDIAIGLARWLGYRFPENFRRPYCSLGFREFWTRWHISLSNWFRDYVYLPLGGSHCSKSRALVNLWATMLASGLWHGANWTFLGWGAYHACLLTIERLTQWPDRLRQNSIGRLVGIPVTLLLTLMGWTFFRSATIQESGAILHQMIFAPWSGGSEALQRLDAGQLLSAAGFAALHLPLGGRFGRELTTRREARLRAGLIVFLFTTAIFLRGPGNAFIYFQF